MMIGTDNEGGKLGSLFIYMAYGEKVIEPGSSKFFRRKNLLHRTLVSRAKQDGIATAITGCSAFGFIEQGAIVAGAYELAPPTQPMWVELRDNQAKLKGFCNKHADLIEGHTMLFRPCERWTLN